MQNSKLILLFKHLDPSDLVPLSKFVVSPFFNHKEEPRRLFEYLKKQYKRNRLQKGVGKHRIYNEIFPKEAFDEKRLKYVMSDLLHLLHRYIAISRFEKDGIAPRLYRLDFLTEGQLEKDYRRELRLAESELSQLAETDKKYFQAFSLLEKEERYAQALDKRERQTSLLQQGMDQLDAFYFLKKLRYLSSMLNQETIIPDTFDKFMMEELERVIYKSRKPDGKLISLYRELFLLLRTDDENHFENFKKGLDANLSALDNIEAKMLFYFGINFCIRKIRNGESRFASDMMDFYARGMEEGYLLSNGEISPLHFKNMVQLGIGLKRFGWLEGFIEKYHRLLPEEHIEGAYHYNLAELNYAKGNIDKAFRHLNLSEFTNIQYNLGAKILLLRMYFEEGETEALLSLLSSFEIYLRRNKKLTNEAKSQYMNFIRILNRIVRYGRSQKEQTQKRLDKYKVVAVRSWLQKCIDSM